MNKNKISSHHGEPNHARSYLPCMDEPEYKSTFSVTVKHPKGSRAISNGQLIKTEEYDSRSNARDFMMTHQESIINDESSLMIHQHLIFLYKEFYLIRGHGLGQITTFEKTAPMSSYLLSLAVGDYNFGGSAKTADNKLVKIRINFFLKT